MDINKYLARLIVEQTRLTNDSVDSQIDSILLGYQDQSSLEPGVDENKRLDPFFKMLLEDPGDEDDQENMAMSDSEPKSDLPAQPREHKIDIDKFAQLVANLVQGYDNLLNIKPVLINRAKFILENGYSPDIVDEFLTVLEREFGYTIEGTGESEQEVPEAPFGGVTGPTAGGVA